MRVKEGRLEEFGWKVRGGRLQGRFYTLSLSVKLFPFSSDLVLVILTPKFVSWLEKTKIVIGR